MQWYQGGIAEAVVTSQTKKAVFLVAIFGSDAPSQELENSLNSEEAQNVVSDEAFVCIRLEAGSQPHKQFADIYTNAKSPSIYCITDKGVPVEIITDSLSSSELKERLESALNRHREVLGLPRPSHAVRPDVTSSSTNIPTASTDTETPSSSQNSRENSAQPENESANVSLDERIQRARELAQARQLQKQKEEDDEQKRREVERRQAGKGMAELKRWQDEQEAKKLLEERKKDREEEKALRQRLREQIAQDRAARNARLNSEYVDQPASTATRPSVASSPPPNFSGQARLQFRLPDGSSQTHAFDPDSTLGHVRQFLRDNQTVPFSDFSLWVAFPRRQFTSEEYGSSLRDLGLLPSAALLILPASGLSHGPRMGGSGSSLWALIAALLGYVVYPITIVWSYFQRALPSPSTSSETVDKSQTSSSGNQGDTLRSNALGQGNKLGGGESRSGNNRGNQPGTSGGLGSSASSANNDDQSQASRKSKEKGKNSASSPDGNVHRLRTAESDSDDEKATWNGNSTQQM